MSQAATGFDPLQWVSSRLFPAGTDAKSQAAQKQFYETIGKSPFLRAATDSLLKQMAMSPEETNQQMLRAGVTAAQLKQLTDANALDNLRGQYFGLIKPMNADRSQIRINEANVNTDNNIRTGNATTDNVLRVLQSQQSQEQKLAGMDQLDAAAYRDHDMEKYKLGVDLAKRDLGLRTLGTIGGLGVSILSAFV